MSPVKSFKNRYNIECITIGGMNFGILVKRAKYKKQKQNRGYRWSVYINI